MPDAAEMLSRISSTMSAPLTVLSSKRVHWIWKVCPDDAFECHFYDDDPQCDFYDDVESMIIEDAYQANERHVIFDDFRIDFSQMRSVSDSGGSVVIKRMTKSVQDGSYYHRGQKGRLSDYSTEPANVNRPGAFGDFIWQAYLSGQWRDIPLPILVERAAQEIIQEGKEIRRRKVSEKLAQLLLEVKHGSRKEIWYRCVYLYTLQSFLYWRLNETLRLETSDEEWKRRLHTLGLFAWFLFDVPQDTNEFEGNVYRKVQISDKSIERYKNAVNTGEVFAFAAFTSTSRNQSRAHTIHGFSTARPSLLIISIVRSRETSVDVSAFSKYPEEEEQLLIPGFLFKVTRVEFDTTARSHIIYLQDCNHQN